MTDIEQLQSLLEHLEMADGPDREIDAHIWAWQADREVIVSPTDPNMFLARNRKPPHDECVLGTIDPGETQRNFTEGYHKPPMPHYTASLDAAVALVEKMLPGWSYKIDHPGAHKEAILGKTRGSVERGGFTGQYHRHKIPAIALLTAMVGALIAEAQS